MTTDDTGTRRVVTHVPKDPATGDYTLTSRDVAKLAGVDPATVRRWVTAGKLTPAVKTPGGVMRFTAREVSRALGYEYTPPVDDSPVTVAELTQRVAALERRLNDLVAALATLSAD